ncbi:MAG: patatin-like phospholipase family protein [Candidatus Omnitrophota bacterium]|nr:patatin-like phospholipase family protein [Candidatus Omnitrophota bacterium]
MENPDNKNMIGLALGSGAAFGLAHIGVLRVLEREKIPVGVVSGASIGALIAAMWCIGLSSNDIEAISAKLKRKLNIMRLLDFTFPISGILAGRRLKRFLRAILGDRTFEDLKIPVKIIVYDLASRETIVADKGRILDAVYKSIAVPGIFQPIMEDGRMYVDGGILDPVPVDILFRSGAKKVIAVNVLPGPKNIRERNVALKEIAKEEENMLRHGSLGEKMCAYISRFFRKVFTPNIFDVIMTSMQAMEYSIAEVNCCRADVNLHPVLSDASSIDFHLVKSFVKIGEEEALRHIDKIRALTT